MIEQIGRFARQGGLVALDGGDNGLDCLFSELFCRFRLSGRNELGRPALRRIGLGAGVDDRFQIGKGEGAHRSLLIHFFAFPDAKPLRTFAGNAQSSRMAMPCSAM